MRAEYMGSLVISMVALKTAIQGRSTHEAVMKGLLLEFVEGLLSTCKPQYCAHPLIFVYLLSLSLSLSLQPQTFISLHEGFIQGVSSCVAVISLSLKHTHTHIQEC